MESKASRSARVKLQLRDSKGRWVQMFSKVKWTDPNTKNLFTGIVSGFDGTKAIVDLHDRHGKNLGKKSSVEASSIEVINEKAEITFDKNGVAIGSKPADSAGPQDSVEPESADLPTDALMDYIAMGHNETTFKIGSEGNKPMFTPTSALKVGDELYPVAKVGKFQKSPYNASGNPASTPIQKYDKGIGTVTKIKEGAYVVISDPEGKTYAVSWSHHALKRSNELDQAILAAQSMEANSIYAGKDAPKIPWIDALKDELNPAIPNKPKAVIPGQEADASEAPESAPEAVETPEAPAINDEPTVPVFDAKKYTLENDSEMSKEIADRLPVGTVLQGVKEDGLVSKNLLEKISDTDWNMWSDGKLVKAVKTENFKNYLSNFPFNKWSPNEPVAPKDNTPKADDIVDGEQIANLPTGSKIEALGNEYTKHEKGYWTTPKSTGGMASSVFKTTPNVKLVELGGSGAAPEEVAPAAPEVAPEANVVEEVNPFGDNYLKKAHPFWSLKKGDVSLFKDGRTGDYIGVGNIKTAEGMNIKAQKFVIDGKEEIVEGKDITASFSPKSLIVSATGENPFGEGYQGFSFDLSKPNNDNFKAGDKVIYGKEKNQGTILSVNPTNILVQKDNSDKSVKGTPTITASQIHAKYSKVEQPAQIGMDASKDVPQITQDEADQIGKIDHAKVDDLLKNGVSSTPTTPGKYADKGKSVQNEQGETMKVNDVVFTPKYGKGTVAIVLPSTDPTKLGSAKVFYDSENGFKVTQAKNLSIFDPNKIADTATKTTGDELSPGETGMNPETGKLFIAGKNGKPIHKGDKVSYTKGGQTTEGVVKGIYAGEKTVAITWDNGTTTGPKKATTLTAINDAPEAAADADAPQTGADEATPEANPETTPEAPAAEEAAPAAATPYSPMQEKALRAYNENYKEIGEHLRGIAAHAFAGAEEIIDGIDNLLKESTLDAPITTFRGFKTSDAKILEGLKVGTIFRDKAFVSTSLDESVAAQSMMAMEGDHSVLIDFELPAGYHAAKVNYEGFSEGSHMKELADEQEVLLPRLVDFQVVSVEETTDVDGNKVLKATVKGIVKSAADSLMGNGIHQVASKTPGDKNPFKILDDPGADGDGFHKTGPWGHFGASGVLVSAKDPETGETKYLIVENGELHEKQNQGLWQLPGGALNGNENPYQGAAREMWEELDVDPSAMEAMEHVGDIEYSNGKGWAYTNIAAKSETMFPVKIDVIETSDYKWASKAELKQMMDDNLLLPAFAQNIDKLLGVYGEDHDVPAAAPEAAPAAVKNIADFTKTGKGQAGSNQGGFYTDNATGEMYYIKNGMKEDHARNEILASKIYNALGVNASVQEEIDLGNGKIGIASKIIATDGNHYNVNLEDSEYLKKVQEDFAIDALLANWDVAGMGYDNILTDAEGNPLRIDPGASLRYRAQGAAKSDFGNIVGEWDYLRTGQNNESSAIKYNKKLFGSMTNQQLVDSANKLNELTDEKLDSIVDSVGFDEKNSQFFKDTLKARREDILQRAAKLVDPTKKDDNVPAPTPAAPDTEAVPEESGQVQLDGQPANADGPANTGGPAGSPAVGDYLPVSALDGLPVGAVVLDKDVKTELTKTGPTTWVGKLPNGSEIPPLETSDIIEVISDNDLQLLSLRPKAAASPDSPLVGQSLTKQQVSELPVGSVIKFQDQPFTKKSADNTWVHENGVSYDDENLTEIFDDGDFDLAEIGVGTYSGVPTITHEEFKVLPIGSVTKATNGKTQYEKVNESEWKSLDSGALWATSTFDGSGMSVISQGSGVDGSVKTFAPGDSVVDQMDLLEVGSVVKVKSGSTTYSKTAEGEWTSQFGTVFNEHEDFEGAEMELVSAPKSETAAPVYQKGDKPKAGDYAKFPVGTVIETWAGYKYTKKGDNHWENVYEATYEDSDLDDAAMKYVSGPEAAVDVQAPATTAKDWNSDAPAAIDMPVGTVLNNPTSGYAAVKLTKTGLNEWTSDTSIQYTDYTIDGVKDNLGWTIEENTPKVEPKKLGDKVVPEDLEALPNGTVIENGTAEFTKIESNTWKSNKSGAQFKNDWFASDKQNFAVTIQWMPSVGSPEGTTATTHEATKINELPIGTKIKTHGETVFTKDTQSYWSSGGVGGWSMSSVLSTNKGQGTVEVLEMGKAPEPTPEAAPAAGFKIGDPVNVWEDIPKFEVGTKIGSGHFAFIKVSDTQWQQGNSTATVAQHNLVSIFNGMDVTVMELPGQPTQTDAPKVGDVLTPTQIKKLPVESVFTDNIGNEWTKVEEGWYKASGTAMKITDAYFGGFGNDVYTLKQVSVDGQKTYKDNTSVSSKEVNSLPVGTVFTDEDGVAYTKLNENEYNVDGGEGEVDKLYFSLFEQDLFLTSVPLPVESNAAATPPTPSVPGKNGEALSVGDTIEWSTKGTVGSVNAIDIENAKVQMLLADGSKKWYASSKMVKKAPVAKPYETPVIKKPKAEGDPNDPLYGTPKPTFTAEKGEAVKPATFLPEGFIEEIEKRYADKVNPSWSKSSPQLSYYWSNVTDFQNTGNPVALAKLHEKLYISDDMLQKAKDHASVFETQKAELDKVHAEAQAAFNEQMKKWKTANGVTSQSFDSHYPATADNEWDPIEGFVTMPDGEVTADWSKAPAGSQSVADILATMAGDDELSSHGISAMIDSDWIRDNNVRFTKVVDDQGITRVQAKFEVSEYRKSAVVANMLKGGSSITGVKAGFLGYIKAGLQKFNKGEHGLTQVSGKSYEKVIENGVLNFQASTGSGWTNNTSAVAASAFITLPENATPRDFEKALKEMGITNAHPSTKQAVDFSKKKQLVSTFMGFVGEGNTKYEDNPALLDQHVKKTLEDLGGGGYTIDDFELVQTDLGFFQFKVPRKLRDELTAKSGVKALVHGNMDWVPEGKSKNSFSLHQWSESLGLERYLSKFTGPTKGYLSTARRMVEGDDSKGMSPEADINSGGARYLFTTPYKNDQWKTNQGYNSGVVAHPSLAFQYLGNYANDSDNGSGKRKEGTKMFNVLKDGYDVYEAMILNGISVKDSWYSFTNSEQKPFLIKSLKERGVDEVNGIPVEQYFVVPGVDSIPAWVDPEDR